ncbi:MAG: T9SS type A sorting domain-containing protein, partial [Candidatus Marinimicrobia bacterium]|nr:T9SS type A sorting domain-containing protein [Candidatus Neomarinimicrobiota bacterium]
MTLTHGDNFSIEVTDRALLADYLTTGNETRLLVITPETDKLFSFSGDFEITELIVANSQNEIPTSLPAVYSLSSAYPNPFNPVTTMTLTMPKSGNINVQVYNLYGQIITTLLSGNNPANTYSLVWDASNSPSGMYFVKAEFGGITETQKLMLIK